MIGENVSMYVMKICLDKKNEDLLERIKCELQSDCRAKILNSDDSPNSIDQLVTIAAASKVIVKVIANIIYDYIKYNHGEIVTFINSNGKRSFTGYSHNEVKDLENYIMEDLKEVRLV